MRVVDVTPKLNHFAVFAMSVAGFGVAGVFSIGASAKLLLIIVPGTVLMAAGILRTLSTRIEPDGVHQRSLLGAPQYLRWDQVERIAFRAKGTFVLCGADAKIVISPVAYRDFDATIEFFQHRLAAVWPTDGKEE